MGVLYLYFLDVFIMTDKPNGSISLIDSIDFTLKSMKEIKDDIREHGKTEKDPAILRRDIEIMIKLDKIEKSFGSEVT